MNRAGPVILTVPGLNGSGPSHWQTLWETSRSDTARVDLGMWHGPHRNSWVTKLDQAVRTTDAPIILAAHGLGCLAVAWWAELAGQAYGWPVAGALLTAPPDVDRPNAAPELKAFGPSPTTALPFPSILAASTDDPWISVDHAHSLAVLWGSHFVELGDCGHVNAASGVGWWDEGQELLERVINASELNSSTTPVIDARSVLAAKLDGFSYARHL